MIKKIKVLANVILAIGIIVAVIIHCYKERPINESIQSVIFGVVLFFISAIIFGIVESLLYKLFAYRIWGIFINVIIVIVFLSFAFLEIGIIVAKETEDIIINQFMILGVYCGLIWGREKALKKL